MTWTIRSLIAWSQGYLREKGSPTARLDAELLLCHAMGFRRLDLYLDMDRPLSPDELAAYRQLIRRRAALEPVAYILGTKEFYGRDFSVTRDVLIPRPESELLVEQACTLAPHGATILEIGVGSGAVIISILAERPDLRAVANDVSRGALGVARENARRHGVAPRLDLLASDGLRALRGDFALIVMNPPYVAEDEAALLDPDVVLYEPHGALFGGEDGLDIIQRVLGELPARLQAEGVLVMEVGYDQTPAIERLVAATGALEIRTWIKELAGKPRVVVMGRTHG